MKPLLRLWPIALANRLVSFQQTIKHQGWWILLFVIGMIIPLCQLSPSYASSTFRDVPENDWAQPCITKLAQQNIIRGYPDGTFKPNAPITRAEFAALLLKAFPSAPQVRSDQKFVDVPTNYWANQAIRNADKTGFLAGYPGRVFRPKQNIPRVQALVSLASGLKYKPVKPSLETLKAAFTDATTIPNYAQNAIAAATENQIVVNRPNVKQFKPNQQASRAEVAAFLCQATQTTGLIPNQYIAKVEPPTPGSTEAELRGVWLTNIDSEVLFSTTAVTDSLEKLKELNFNTVYPTVWNWGYTLYPSQVAKRVVGLEARISTELEKDLFDPDKGVQGGRDVLKEIVEVGHDNGLRVIPWFEFGFKAPSYSELAKRHPDWLTQTKDGVKTQTTKGLEPEDERLQEIVWLNPFKPEVQQFIQDLVIEIVSNYDVDGIQFDDHFGLPVTFGYDDFTVELYKKEHQGKSPPTDPKDQEWVRWRANKITDFLTKLFRAVKDSVEDSNNDVIISLSPNPQRFSYQFFLADWASWEQRGLVEELIVQIYRDNFSTFISELDQTEVKRAQSHIPVGIGILSGLRTRLVPVSQIQRQVDAVRLRGFAGVSFFFYETLLNMSDEPASKRQSGFEVMFPEFVKAPDIEDWKKSN
ncbi:MAG: family 10 glycosylhydrolase [Moorea sp. SIOASIH]|uniref:glycoside hydrolase family 10 protein n=1 Tax=Moorena sp. SIOASIH TaxID=2607817 RepID=UPI0013BD2C58|nr:family 10 glycosylhydrolase [Moorena sp. SIOASIH]NEO35059.1 family 10 glycosylhydrolase [Moorena sp. SIOASIH]